MTNDNKVKEIFDTLDILEEELSDLAENLYRNLYRDINPEDSTSIQEGLKSLGSFNDTLNAFYAATNQLKAQIKNHDQPNPGDREFPSPDQLRIERIFKELEKYPPHYLNEDFKFKKPYGFTIRSDMAYAGLTTWKDFYLETIKYLRNSDSEKFAKLLQEARFIFNSRRPLFSSHQNRLTSLVQIDSNLYVEVGLSANHIRDNVRAFLDFYDLDIKAMKIYLR